MMFKSHAAPNLPPRNRRQPLEPTPISAKLPASNGHRVLAAAPAATSFAPPAPPALPSTAAAGSADPVASSLRQLAEQLKCAHITLASLWPRGAFQIGRSQSGSIAVEQPPGANIDRIYIDHHSGNATELDRLGFWAIRHRAAVSPARVPALLREAGVASLALTGVDSPLFDGYPGVLIAHRLSDGKPFSQDDLGKLAAAGGQLGEAARKSRRDRAAASQLRRYSTAFAVSGVVGLSPDGETRLGEALLMSLDANLRSQLIEAASRFGSRRGRKQTLMFSPTDDDGIRHLVRATLVPLADAETFAETFHAATPKASDHKANGKIAEPLVLFCFMPTIVDWLLVRREDIGPDRETSRLLPAIAFMVEQVAQGPRLTAIAEKADFSPFHFHRLFSERFGLTPKQMMLAAQVALCQRMLADGDVPLPRIAELCGFAQQSHFTSRFKQATGLTPTRWRAKAWAPRA